MIADLIGRFAYLGLFGALAASGLGLPVAEELPVITAAALAQAGLLRWWVALPVCLVGALSGDLALYWGGRWWGPRLVACRAVAWVLSPARAARLAAAYQRHVTATVFATRYVVGLRMAALLTAGMARVPFWRFLRADAGAAALGVSVAFGLAYVFAAQLELVLADIRALQRWLGLLAILGIASCLATSAWRRGRRVASR